MKKTCENCKHKDTDYSVYPCMDCFHKSKWEEWQDTNYYPTTEDLIIEELEKIKAEIIGSCNNIAQEVSDLSYTRKIYVYEQLSEIKGAIDNHISELKGE
ncbi:MAG: hypothetical protein J6S67_14925 [Methanobrevibacter sp.]|nr:hypothetical protein [Methanobrevibacter sp.]